MSLFNGEIAKKIIASNYSSCDRQIEVEERKERKKCQKSKIYKIVIGLSKIDPKYHHINKDPNKVEKDVYKSLMSNKEKELEDLICMKLKLNCVSRAARIYSKLYPKVVVEKDQAAKLPWEVSIKNDFYREVYNPLDSFRTRREARQFAAKVREILDRIV